MNSPRLALLCAAILVGAFLAATLDLIDARDPQMVAPDVTRAATVEPGSAGTAHRNPSPVLVPPSIPAAVPPPPAAGMLEVQP